MNIHYLVFVIIMLSHFVASSQQFNKLSKDKIIKNKIRSYSVKIAGPDPKSSLYNRTMERVIFNLNGNIKFRYNFTPDVVYTNDSVLYNYFENKLIEIVEYNIDVPEGAQLKLLKEMNSKADTTIRCSKFFYNAQGHKIRKEYFENGEFVARESFSYNEDALLIKVQSEYARLPEVNNVDVYYEYDTLRRNVYKKEVYPLTRSETEYFYIYDFHGNLLTEHIKGRKVNTYLVNTYNQNNLLIKSIKQGTNAYDSEPFERIEEYVYDSTGNMIEKKKYSSRELYSWTKYFYNDEGLLMKELWLDEKKGEVSEQLNFFYEFYQ